MGVFDDNIAKWEAAGLKVETYRNSTETGLPHDEIDPNQPVQQIDMVYP